MTLVSLLTSLRMKSKKLSLRLTFRWLFLKVTSTLRMQLISVRLETLSLQTNCLNLRELRSRREKRRWLCNSKLSQLNNNFSLNRWQLRQLCKVSKQRLSLRLQSNKQRLHSTFRRWRRKLSTRRC